MLQMLKEMQEQMRVDCEKLHKSEERLRKLEDQYRRDMQGVAKELRTGRTLAATYTSVERLPL